MTWPWHLLLFGLLIGSNADSQNVFVPDTNFKKVLIANPELNTNNDTEIQVSEATAYTGVLNVQYKNILDLTGIAYFTNLKKLYCDANELKQLDLTKNTQITHLFCSDNNLNQLDLSKNFDLYLLDCDGNQLTSLNLTHNTKIEELFCANNKLSEIGLSNSIHLKRLWCWNNLLTELHLQNNTQLKTLICNDNYLKELDLSSVTELYGLECANNQLHKLNLKNGQTFAYGYFDATSNLSLKCIQVDVQKLWDSLWTPAKPSLAKYSIDCDYLINGTHEFGQQGIEIYPNPTDGKFRMNQKGGQRNQVSINILNMLGQSITHSVVELNYSTQHNIDISDQPSGIYILEATFQDKRITQKIILK